MSEELDRGAMEPKRELSMMGADEAGGEHAQGAATSEAPASRGGSSVESGKYVAAGDGGSGRRLVGVVAIIVVAILVVSSGFLTNISLAGWSDMWNNLGLNKVITTTNVDQRILKEESLVIDVSKNTKPSVVSIGASRSLSQWFGGGEESQEQGIGTGFIISEDGLILTNKHVVADTSITYTVVTNDEKRYEVKNIYRDPVNDLAIIKIEASGLEPIELGDSGSLEVGQFVIAIGNALGEFSNTVTTGVVSGLGRSITAGSSSGQFQEQLDNVIQTDAAINSGNSGGPLLNSAGQVIGINTAVSTSGQNLGFAIPINDAKPILDEFKRTGKIAGPAYLGVSYQVVTQRTALLNEVPQGMYIQQVVAGSPAAEAGIQTGDIVTKIDDKDMRESNDLSTHIRSKKIGDTVKLTYWREGQDGTKTVEAKLIESPAQ